MSFNSLMMFLYGSVRLFCTNEDFSEKYVFLCYLELIYVCMTCVPKDFWAVTGGFQLAWLG